MPVMIAVSEPAMARASVRVARDAGGHQQAADIGVAEAERAVFVGEFGNAARRELRHHHRDFENDGPQTNGMLVVVDVDALEAASLVGQSGSAKQDCRPCRRGTCTPSTGWMRGSGRRPGWCASRSSSC